jgi:hypothetical protein
MKRRIAAIALVLMFGSATTASAQFPTLGLNEPPAPLIREAFASPYGHALTAELGRALRAGADPACLSTKGIAADRLEPRGEALLIKWGTQATETAMTLINFDAYEKAFPANSELKGLREQPEIKRYLELERPIRLARALDFIFQQFDRYNLLQRMKIASVSPLSTGKEALLGANPTEAAEDAVDAFAAAHKSAPMERFLALSEQAAEAMQGAVDREQVLRIGPTTFYRGLDLDLAELCIVPTNK